MENEFRKLAKGYHSLGRNGLQATGVFVLLIIFLCIREGHPPIDSGGIIISIIVGALLFFANLYRLRKSLIKIADRTEASAEERQQDFSEFHRNYLFFIVPLFFIGLIAVSASVVVFCLCYESVTGFNPLWELI